MGMRRALGIGASVLMLLLAGCTGGDGEPAALPSARVVLPTTDDEAARPTAGPGRPALLGVVTAPDCTSDCAAGFDLSGQDYILSCEAIPPSSLETDVLGEGTLYDRQVDVRKISAGARSGAVAVGPMPDYCGPRQPPTHWYLYAYPR